MNATNSVVMARGKGEQKLGGESKGEDGIVCNSVNNKNKDKNLNRRVTNDLLSA